MTLTIKKLENLLYTRGFLAKRYYSINDSYVYIELININTADTCMLYIPSKYDIKVDKLENVFKIDYINVDENGNIPVDYAGEADPDNIEKQYDNIDIEDDAKNLISKLENNYNHPIKLSERNQNDNKELVDIIRQLKRLRFCVQTIKYKVVIMYNSYLCCIKRDDTIQCFTIYDSNNKCRKLMISLDLETLYEKIGEKSNFNTISNDIKTVYNGIYRVFDKNQYKHTENIEKISENIGKIKLFSDNIFKKKMEYNNYLVKLEILLESLIEPEKQITEKIAEIESKYKYSKTLQSDMEKSQLIAKQNEELEKLNIVKQDIIKNIISIKNKHEELTLIIDKIMFDNHIMLDCIIKNFIKLSEF
jgi:hypothetical protein|uniref:Uncharacterized protein n=1 Tax=viral metagenome TaxID=1070528 RepID=A0A6C0D1M0_9ZZZZ